MAQVQIPPQPQQQMMAMANGAPPTAVPIAGTTSLYVGDLSMNVSESQIYDMFNQIGTVVSVRICRDINTRRSLGYGYVNYNTPLDAARALEMLNFTPLNGRPIRIMYSNRDPSSRKSGAANIFIKNLDKSIDNKALYETFAVFGCILSCKVVIDNSGQSKGYGFVQYDVDESALLAIEKLNGMLLNDKKVFVGPFVRRHERENASNIVKFNNVFVKNLSENTTEDDLINIFGEFGKITSVVVMREGDGKSKCFGFVNFEDPDAAARAVHELHGKKVNDKEWYVGKAQKKSDRELELKVKFEQNAKESADRHQGANLYLKYLDDNIEDKKLKELFSSFGTITSSKVMRDSNGLSRGSGFVSFSTPEEASRALNEMNGKIVGSKPLYVAIAQRKEDRRARLQAQFSQMRPVPMPSVASRVPIYPPGGPGQVFYGQPPAALIPPPQAPFGYQQLVPGMRAGAASVSNYYLSMVQGQQAQRPGGRRTGGGHVQNQHHIPILQQQHMGLRGGRYMRGFLPGRNIPDTGISTMAGGMVPVPYDIGGLPPVREPTISGLHSTISTLATSATSLANATSDQQRSILGENLYPLVERLESDMAAKITGMLLEMDQTEVLHLLESPEALSTKVYEAIDVLKSVQQQQQSTVLRSVQQQQFTAPTDQLAILSINDGV